MEHREISVGKIVFKGSEVEESPLWLCPVGLRLSKGLGRESQIEEMVLQAWLISLFLS